MIRVFIVDDSAFVRKALTRVLTTDRDVTVVGEARNGYEALERIPRVEPDLVTLDLAMDGLDGLQTLRGLLTWRPTLPVIMLSAHTRRGADATIEALALGAVDFIDKTAFSLMDVDGLGREALARIKAWEPGRRAAPGAAATTTAEAAPPRTRVDGPRIDRCELLVIGASTGGPAAIQRILEALPATFPLPVVIVQHMPPGFTRAFAERLNGLCRLDVREAVDGDRLRQGRVLVAPGGLQCRITPGLTVALSEEKHGARHVPSVDVLFESAARARPGRVAAVLLTGMGDDGAGGMATIRAGGGVTVAEHEASCVVYGMPRAAVERGAATCVMRADEIAAWLGAT